LKVAFAKKLCKAVFKIKNAGPFEKTGWWEWTGWGFRQTTDTITAITQLELRGLL
jgi:hypothetical protein